MKTVLYSSSNEQIGDLLGLLDTFYYMAMLEFKEQRLLRAVQIYSAAEALRMAKKGGASANFERYAQIPVIARAELGDAAMDRAWTAGQHMTWQETVAFARASY